MDIQDKALYNLLRINWQEDPSLKVKSWQVEDYRRLSTEELFSRLSQLGIMLSPESLIMYAETLESPEDLADCLWVDEEDKEGYDQAYLILFELWRRFLPDKQTLSIFCDELDHRIDLYDQQTVDDDLIQRSLKELEDILDQSIDRGEDPQQVFATIATYCAHDLESFLYDYISHHIEAGNNFYASELLDGFYSYVHNVKWFDFLKVKLLMASNEEEADFLLRGLLEQLEEEPDLELLIEIATFLIHQNDERLFIQVVGQASALMKTEEDFHDLLTVVIEYFRLMDKDGEYARFKAFLENRLQIKPSSLLSPADKEVAAFKSYFSKKTV